MTEKMLSPYLRLRLIVGYLGERAQFGWWATSFFERSSRLFLEPVFSKTTRLAQYHGVREAARRLHDDHVGLGNVFHLFRLPEEIEQDLHKMMQEARGDENMLLALQSKDAALDALTKIASPANVAAEGPISVGKLGELYTPDVQKANVLRPDISPPTIPGQRNAGQMKPSGTSLDT